MADLFIRLRDSRLSMNHLGIWKHLGKCSNGILRTSTLVNFASALNKVNNVKISDYLSFF